MSLQTRIDELISAIGADVKELYNQLGNISSASVDIHQTAHGLSVGNVIRFDGTNYVKAKADSAINAEVVGIVKTITDADNFVFVTSGYVGGLTGLTAGSVYFLDSTTAGAITITEPIVIGQISKPIFIATSTTEGQFFNMRGSTVVGPSDPQWFTPSGTFTYASAITITTSVDLTNVIGVGYRFRLVQTTTKYFIVTKVTSTTITVYGGTQYTLANAAISSVAYASVYAPLGFPLRKDFWTISANSSADLYVTNPTSSVWYTPSGSPTLSLPIGIWVINFRCCLDAGLNSGGISELGARCGFGQTADDIPDYVGGWRHVHNPDSATTLRDLSQMVSIQAFYSRTSATSLHPVLSYFSPDSADFVGFDGGIADMIWTAQSAYV